MSAALEYSPAPGARNQDQRDDIARAVVLHCRRLQCDQSNTVASVAWALRAAGDTLAAIRAGRDRAAQLRHRQAAPAVPA